MNLQDAITIAAGIALQCDLKIYADHFKLCTSAHEFAGWLDAFDTYAQNTAMIKNRALYTEELRDTIFDLQSWYPV